MLTGMTEQDWRSYLRCSTRCNRAGESLGMTTVNSWRQSTISRSTALPGGLCPGIWQLEQRMETICGSPVWVFEAFFQILAESSQTAHLVQIFDSTAARAHVSAAGAKGGNGARHSSLARRLLDQNTYVDGLRLARY